MATIQMDLQEYDRLRENARAQELEILRLQDQLQAALLNAGGDERVGNLTSLARALLQCTRFAVSQMPPEATKGWPLEDLLQAAGMLQHLPDHSAVDSEISLAFRQFASECARVERGRAVRVAMKPLPAQEASEPDPQP